MRLLIVSLIAALAAIPAAHAAVPSTASKWERVDGPVKAGNQLGLLRTNGTLQVVWAQGAPATITDTRLDANGNAIGSSVVASGFDGLGGLALVGMGDGSVRLFAAGGRVPGLPSSQIGINSFVSPAGGTTWSLDPSALWGGAVANAADAIGATISGGQPITAWSGAVVHVGLGPSAGDPSYQPDCCGVGPSLVTDASGSVVMSWISNGHESGTYVKQIFPSTGAIFSLPSGLTEGSSGIAARIGAPGVYVAFAGADGKVKLYEYGGGIQTVATGSFRIAKVFSAPDGRLWVVWGDNDGIWVTRSNKAVSRFESVQHLALPAGTSSFFNAQGEGSAGPLDLFADVLTGSSDRGFWRTHLLPLDTLSARTTYSSSQGGGHAKKTTAHVEFTLTDAGDPVSGAIIAVRAGGSLLAHLKTGGDGGASLNVPLGSKGTLPKLSATATAPGYPNAIIVVAHRG